MRKSIATVLLLGIALLNTTANESVWEVSLEEFEVTSPREHRVLWEQPLSFSFIPAEQIERTNIKSLHDLSSLVPNFSMPDYGSKITSSIFIRGIGSRMNEPSVGLYIDNIPLLSKSSFDFGFYDIQSIELLRGPQGTLYGRNTIGGLIRINTISPFDFQGTRLFASYGTANDQLYRLSHYRMLNDRMAISLAGYYHSNDGFFTNEFTGKKDNLESFGGRLRFEWRPNPIWNINFSAMYDNVSQLAYPYAPYNIETGEVGVVNYNEEGSYRREMLNLGLTFQRRTPELLFTSASSFQYFDDRMRIDQDFTKVPIFALTQNQLQNAFTQEFIFRSRGRTNYQWVTGAFGFHQRLNIDAPMIFREGALGHLVPNLPPFIVSRETNLPGKFDISTFGVALYHQSSYTFWDRLTLTAGVRFEVERSTMNYNTSAEMTINTRPPNSPDNVGDTIRGRVSQDFFAVLPKIALRYEFNNRHSMFASVSRGHRTGGFNFQMFGDVLQQNLMSQVPPMPNMPPLSEPITDVNDIISYRPEFTINYEIGLRSQLVPNRLFLDLAVFYIDYTDQQIVTFSSTNIGSRMMENAGRSESMGVEIAVRARDVLRNLDINVAYGHTHAVFREYNDGQNDFTGNFLPLVPRNTFSAGLDYRLQVINSFWDNIVFRVQYNGLGRIYFTEENRVSQGFFGTLSGSISFEKGNFSLNGWIRNALNEEYNTFYFTSLNDHFVQRGRPRQLGVSAQFSF